jgi:hypothetical protein
MQCTFGKKFSRERGAVFSASAVLSKGTLFSFHDKSVSAAAKFQRNERGPGVKKQEHNNNRAENIVKCTSY